MVFGNGGEGDFLGGGEGGDVSWKDVMRVRFVIMRWCCGVLKFGDRIIVTVQVRGGGQEQI